MTDKLTEKLVARAVALDREVAEKTDELKCLKKQLVELASFDEDAQTPTDGGGWSWTAQDREGNIARVTVPAPSLKGSVEGEGELIEKVRAVAGRLFNKLFVQAPAYKLVADFRDAARGRARRPRRHQAHQARHHQERHQGRLRDQGGRVKVETITIKPKASGILVRVAEEEKLSRDHAFSGARDAVDFIAALLFAHEKGEEIAAKAPRKNKEAA